MYLKHRIFSQFLLEKEESLRHCEERPEGVTRQSLIEGILK